MFCGMLFKGIALQWYVGFLPYTSANHMYVPTSEPLSHLTLRNALHFNFIIKQSVEDIRCRYSAKLACYTVKEENSIISKINSLASDIHKINKINMQIPLKG